MENRSLGQRRARSRRAPLLLGLAVAIAMLGMTAQPAGAHYVYQKVVTYASDTTCSGERAETSHGGGGGYARADVYSWYSLWTPWGQIDCGSDFPRPPGYLADAYDLYKWTGYEWALCRYTAWYYNGSQTHQFAIATNFGGYPPCGPGYYGTVGVGYVWNNAWYGGSSWSGYHYLPA